MNEWKDPRVELPNKDCVVEIKFLITEIDNEMELETTAFFNKKNEEFLFSMKNDRYALPKAIQEVKAKLSITKEDIRIKHELHYKKLCEKLGIIKKEIFRTADIELGKHNNFSSTENINCTVYGKEDLTLEKWRKVLTNTIGEDK